MATEHRPAAVAETQETPIGGWRSAVRQVMTSVVAPEEDEVDPERFATLTRIISIILSRRSLAGALGLSAAGLASRLEAGNKRKKRKRRKRKNKCGKPGRQPIKGKCCKGAVRVDGRCQRCDVCANGCAFSSVQAAIDAADNGDTIALCPGTYRGNLVFDSNLSTATPLRLIGAGDGNGASDTLVQGPRDDAVVRITASVVSLEKLRITGGLGFLGGGIYTHNATVELISCTVTENEAVANGGGIYNQNGTLTLRNSTISENEASGGVGGGGIFNDGTLNLIASEIRRNESAKGGGIYNHISNVTADAASTIRDNGATISGGGIYNDSGIVTLASSAIVSDNSPDNCAGPAAVAYCIG
jgi:hypothetical protein